MYNYALIIAIPVPPENISWTIISYQQQDIKYYVIAFEWNTHPLNCRPTYNILPSNCGSCPTTTNHTTITCIDVPTDDGVCMFAVQTVVCERITGEFSPRVSVDIFQEKG